MRAKKDERHRQRACPAVCLVVVFPVGKANFSGEMASELTALIESNAMRVLDLLLLTKGLETTRQGPRGCHGDVER